MTLVAGKREGSHNLRHIIVMHIQSSNIWWFGFKANAKIKSSQFDRDELTSFKNTTSSTNNFHTMISTFMSLIYLSVPIVITAIDGYPDPNYLRRRRLEGFSGIGRGELLLILIIFTVALIPCYGLSVWANEARLANLQSTMENQTGATRKLAEKGKSESMNIEKKKNPKRKKQENGFGNENLEQNEDSVDYGFDTASLRPSISDEERHRNGHHDNSRQHHHHTRQDSDDSHVLEERRQRRHHQHRCSDGGHPHKKKESNDEQKRHGASDTSVLTQQPS